MKRSVETLFGEYEVNIYDFCTEKYEIEIRNKMTGKDAYSLKSKKGTSYIIPKEEFLVLARIFDNFYLENLNY